MIPFPVVPGGFQVVYVDPPWPHYGSPQRDQAAGKHYTLMTMDEIKALPVRSLLAKPSVCFMWTTGTHLLTAADLFSCWGLHYRNVGFVWVKTTKAGKVIGGQGARPSIVKQMCEYVLVGSTVERGRPLPLLDESIGQVVEEPENDPVYAPRPGNKHSAKPPEVRRRIDLLFGPNVRKIELFAREQAPGWTGWGDQCPTN